MMKAFAFPGQGSQHKGMGENLFDEFPALTAEADAVLGYSIKSLCLENANEFLNFTQYTQPALYTVNALTFLKKMKSEDKPDFVAGHSLGEYNALFAAGVFDFKTGLQLVKKRGELMSQASEGAMIAVIGFQKNEMQSFLKDNNLNDIAIANHNAPLQIVLSGDKTIMVDVITLLATNTQIRVIPLKVSGAFHSHLMQSAKDEYEKFLEDFNFSIPDLPVLSNIDAKPYHPAIIKNNLTNQITKPVEWVAIMDRLLSHEKIKIEEVGPGNVLTGLAKQFVCAENRKNFNRLIVNPL